MEQFERNLGYQFKNKALLEVALTHSSYAHEHQCQSNERMEFLGDSVLSIIISDFLFRKLRREDEGDLSKIRASLVCEQSLARVARELEVGPALKLGRGEDAAGGRARDSILSDAFEAILAAIYLDSDIHTAEQWVKKHMEQALHAALRGESYQDYKTMFQEAVQKNGPRKIAYRVLSETGPDHHKDFEIEVCVDGKSAGRGRGQSKKEAEQNAAKTALERI